VNSTAFRGNFLTDTGGPDHMYAQWMFYRVNGIGGDTRERPFGNYTSGTVTTGLTGAFSGNTATYNLTDSALLGTRFTATWTRTLLDGPSAGAATLTSSLVVRNPNLTPLSISLFHYVDFDLNGTPGGDSATGGAPGLIQTDGAVRLTYLPGTLPSAYQGATYPGIQDLLTDSAVNNLNNTGLPFANGDFSMAYQWNLTIPGNSSVTLTSVTAITPVPEPAAVVAVAAVGLGLAGLVRRRFKGRAARRTLA
jgi:hypothetical protein